MQMTSNNRIVLASRLAIRDWFHELGLSLCAVIALASILAPLLVLHGAHSGVIETMRANLLRDPQVLVISPQGSKGAGFDEAFISEIDKLEGATFAIGRVRDVAAELQLTSESGRRAMLPLYATAPGDPVFTNFSAAVPESSPERFAIALSSQAARRLDVAAGAVLQTSLARRLSSGSWQRKELEFTVVSVLPPMAFGPAAGFVDMQTLLALQDFRDGISSDLLDFAGEREAPEVRRYESFRLYAQDLDHVEALEKWFNERDIPVVTRARDIAVIRKIDSTLGAVIGLIAGAGISGFFAFMASSAEASVRRKWKQIGMLRLTGFSKSAILVFVLCGALLTAIVGCLLAFGVYEAVSWCIDILFAEQTGGEAICVLSPASLAFTVLGVVLIAVLASGRAALRASGISPSAAIREV